MSKQKMQKNINLDNLDLNRCYTVEEFELISKKLKFSSIEIKGQPVNLFELDKSGKLVPMPPTTISMEAVVGEIARQLGNWNVWTRQNGIVTTSQGGFDFNVGGQITVRAPDVAFLTRDVYNGLTQQQRNSFQGDPFSPTFAVEVADLSDRTVFRNLDNKIKNEYFATESSVRHVWLVDPRNKEIHLYRRNMKRYQWGWKNIGGDDVLPGFTLDVSEIDELIEVYCCLLFFMLWILPLILFCNHPQDSESEAPNTSESSNSSENSQEARSSNGSEMSVSSSEGSGSSDSSGSVNCPRCGENFDDDFEFMLHYERQHARLRRRRNNG
jgi:Uma2 family endonuclease